MCFYFSLVTCPVTAGCIKTQSKKLPDTPNGKRIKECAESAIWGALSAPIGALSSVYCCIPAGSTTLVAIKVGSLVSSSTCMTTTATLYVATKIYQCFTNKDESPKNESLYEEIV